MLIDLSILVTRYRSREALDNEKIAAFGHMGTHFDVMDKEFPLEFLRRKAVVFEVPPDPDREIGVPDIDLSLVGPGMFAAFRTGFIERHEYGSKEYFSGHPQLSEDLIEALLERGVSIIGIDFAGMRRGSEHTPKDQYCADRGVFVVENLCNLDAVLRGRPSASCVMYTFPIKFAGLSGLPCRVAAEL
ncbi:MAG TPA: cyclase family protein [Spirochaetia bacterium]|nr:cyclase family protein [Spirochaetales bacterium]HRY81038.1 cyclase family protein [Spirochaetia bacterium]HRZ89664.1 cyclase family protein [Spirochaetia bacterium]